MEELYYIQDTRSYCGNSCYWWRVDGQGYTTNLAEAWRVPRHEAEQIVHYRPDIDKAWPCSVIDAKSKTITHLDSQALYGEKSLVMEVAK